MILAPGTNPCAVGNATCIVAIADDVIVVLSAIDKVVNSLNVIEDQNPRVVPVIAVPVTDAVVAVVPETPVIVIIASLAGDAPPKSVPKIKTFSPTW